MQISPGRDLILSLAGKRVRGEVFTARERSFLEAFATLPGFANPMKLACPNCPENVVVIMSDAEAPPAQTFARDQDESWRCLRCGERGLHTTVVDIQHSL